MRSSVTFWIVDLQASLGLRTIIRFLKTESTWHEQMSIEVGHKTPTWKGNEKTVIAKTETCACSQEVQLSAFIQRQTWTNLGRTTQRISRYSTRPVGCPKPVSTTRTKRDQCGIRRRRYTMLDADLTDASDPTSGSADSTS